MVEPTISSARTRVAITSPRSKWWIDGQIVSADGREHKLPDLAMQQSVFCWHSAAAPITRLFVFVNFFHGCPMKRLLCVALPVLFLLPSLADAQTKRKPNIVVILADDMGYADVGFQGCKDIPTPHLDGLANRGIRFTSGYVSGPYCSPTRAGFLTGRYQTRFGHEFNPGPGGKGENFGLPLSEITIANRLKAAGYVTGLVGKWHLGDSAKYHPQMRGFDEYFGFLGGAHTYFPGTGAPILRGTKSVAEKEYLTDAFAREAVSFIDRHKNGPFFLYLAFNAVHTPMDATDDRLQRFAGV